MQWKSDINCICQNLKIIIYNQDNQALSIDSIQVKGYIHEIVARFTEPANYFLTYGNEKAVKASYDIERFTDKIPDTLKALKLAGLKMQDMDVIEINEAFAAQSLAVVRELGLNPDIVNVNGGAIALGHPLGCTGAKLSVQLFDEMKLRGSKYGIVSMCVGTGQGAAGVYEFLK